MKGRIVEVDYIWKERPNDIRHGWVAINCEELPGFVDDFISFYFDDENEFEKAHEDFYCDFKIIEVIG